MAEVVGFGLDIFETVLRIIPPVSSLASPSQEALDAEAAWLAKVEMPLQECTFEEAQTEIRKVCDGTIERAALRINDDGYKAFAYINRGGPRLDDNVIHLYQCTFEFRFSQYCAKDFQPNLEGN